MFNPENKKVILTVDGGGMKGAMPAAMIRELERSTQKPIHKTVDFVSGTSTGAVIAALIALGYDANWIVEEVYQKRLPEAFGITDWRKWGRLALNGFRHIYDIERFTDVFSDVISDIRVADVPKPILLTVKDIRNGSTYYISNFDSGLKHFGDWKLIDAVIASASAPGYFKAFMNKYTDGGIGAHNSPSMITALEIFEYSTLGYASEDSLMLSFGTGYANSAKNNNPNAWGPFTWLDFVLKEMFEDSSSFYPNLIQRMYPELDYRRYNLYLDNATYDTMDVRPYLVEMMNANYNKQVLDLKKLAPDSTAPHTVQTMITLGEYYARQIQWDREKTMPWNYKGGQPKSTIIKD